MHDESSSIYSTSTASSNDTGETDGEMPTEEYVAIDTFTAEGPGQVNFQEGDTIQVLEKLEEGTYTLLAILSIE